MKVLKERIDEENYNKLIRIKNSYLHKFIARYIELCNPTKIFVSDGSKEAIEYIRKAAIKNGEETPLAIEGHTVHFDNYYDQARDRDGFSFSLNLAKSFPDNTTEPKNKSFKPKTT
ncbi:MAG: hypothetical protein J7K62_03970 [Thermoplasmata archaeon]|nr:hypothetical protein [Thermoplasmata archaeon]